MKIKEYATERIKDIQEFLKGDGIEESIRRNNYSVIEILEYIEDMCMAEVKETLERFEKNFEIYYERNGFDEISDAINFYFNNKNDFTILLNDTSLNVPFIIENIYIEELKRTVDEYNEKYRILKRWRAEKGEIYYSIAGVDVIKIDSENLVELDNRRYELGNYFQKKEEAQKIIDSKEWQDFWAKVRSGEIGND